MSIKLLGCKEVALNLECENNAPGEIVSPMFGEFGFIKNLINKGKPVVSVGMSLKTSDPVSFECGPNKNKYVLSGGAIALVTPIDKMSKTFTLKFKASGGKQKPTKFEGGLTEKLVLEKTFPPTPPEEAGLTATDTNTNEEPLEIKAKE